MLEGEQVVIMLGLLVGGVVLAVVGVIAVIAMFALMVVLVPVIPLTLGASVVALVRKAWSFRIHPNKEPYQ